MTTYSSSTLRCGLCLRRITVSHLTSWFSANPTVYLDLHRPGLPGGLTGLGLQRCDECGYIAANLAKWPSLGVRAFFKKERERAGPRDDVPWSECAARLAEHLNQPEAAFRAYRMAAWSLEEQHAFSGPGEAQARAAVRDRLVQWRLAAARALAQVASGGQEGELAARPRLLAAIRADLLRRAGAFSAGLEIAQAAWRQAPCAPDDEGALQERDMLAFQVRRCQAQDDGAYTLWEAYSEAPDFEAREAAREAVRARRNAVHAARLQAQRDAVAPLRLVERLEAAARAGVSTDPDLQQALQARDPPAAARALAKLPLPSSLVTVLESCSHHYHWPPHALVVLLSAALGDVLPELRPRLLSFLSSEPVRAMEGPALQRIQPYLVRCLARTSAQDWYYAAPRVTADDGAPPTFR